jgi:hypothetical protein
MNKPQQILEKAKNRHRCENAKELFELLGDIESILEFKLTSREVNIVNTLVEPFVEKEWEKKNPTAVGTTERGVVITLQDATKVLVRIYRSGEKIPK